MQLDKYARDYREWRNAAAINYAASKALFETKDPFMFFPAATLGHHALEMYLKSALIVHRMAIFNPKDLPRLDPSIGLKRDDCAWGHDLVKLAKRLAERNRDFDVTTVLDFPAPRDKGPLDLEQGLEIFGSNSSLNCAIPKSSRTSRDSGSNISGSWTRSLLN